MLTLSSIHIARVGQAHQLPIFDKFSFKESLRRRFEGGVMTDKILPMIGAVCALIPFQAGAQTPTDIAAFKGLAPVTVLSSTAEGKAALTANYKVTGGIQ